MLKKITTLGIVGFMAATPLLVSADQISDLQQQVQALLAQIAQLTHAQSQNDDENAVGGNGLQCTRLSSTLSVGSTDAATGGQVSQLQDFLTIHFNISEDIVSGYYGVRTALYVNKFQAEQGIDQVGFVGRRTRAAIATMSCPSLLPTPALSAQPAGGTVPLQVQFTGSHLHWNSSYMYDIDFGDGSASQRLQVIPPPCAYGADCSTILTGAYASHTYQTAGTYTAALTQGGIRSVTGCKPPVLATVTITVSPTPTPTTIPLKGFDTLSK